MNDGFRERLFKLDHVTPALKERYDQEVHAMLQKQITGARRWVWLGSAVVCVVIAVLLGILAILSPPEVPPLARIGVAVGALFSLGFAVLGLRIWRRGSIDLKGDTAVYNGLIWVFVVLLITLLMVIAPDSIIGLRMILSGLAFLVMGAVFLIRHVIEQSELKTREKLLEIEYQLAELAETARLGAPSGLKGTTTGPEQGQ